MHGPGGRRNSVKLDKSVFIGSGPTQKSVIGFATRAEIREGLTGLVQMFDHAILKTLKKQPPFVSPVLITQVFVHYGDLKDLSHKGLHRRRSFANIIASARS